MDNSVKAFVSAFLLLGAALQYLPVMAREVVRFNSDQDAAVIVSVINQAVEFEVVGLGKKSHEIISLDIDVGTLVHIDVIDYNFDGDLDFSVWYWDEGKRTYTIHRIFLFSRKSAAFKEYFPECGDEFLNLEVDEARHSLVSTYFKSNVAALCISKPPRKID